MKTKQILMLTLVLLGVSLAREAQAFYNPSTGRWLSRDPIAESGGLDLYGLVANNGINIIDPLGQHGTGGCACCECAKAIDISPIEFYDEKGRYGHVFVVNVYLDYTVAPEQGEATLQWWEWTDTPTSWEISVGIQPYQWYDLQDKKFNPPLGQSDIWWMWHGRDQSCNPEVGRIVKLVDRPTIYQSTHRMLRFDILVVNPPKCLCKKPNVRITASQVLDRNSNPQIHKFDTPDSTGLPPRL
jgi:hypothetical protein